MHKICVFYHEKIRYSSNFMHFMPILWQASCQRNWHRITWGVVFWCRYRSRRKSV
jgi:hypothetical protein